jgi:RNA polymerase sigma factor (sigma-70 family)
MAIKKNGAVRRHLHTLFNVGAIGALTDGQLLERFAAGTGEPRELAFAALVERHGPFVLRTCQAVLGNEHEADDAFQATFLAVARKARTLSARDSLGPWLHQAACRAARHDRAARMRRRAHERAAAQRVEYLLDHTNVQEGLERMIHEEINRLPAHYRVALVLCDLQGRTHEQAARHLGCAVGTVKSRLARGREKLRGRLVRRGIVSAASLLTALPASVARAAVPVELAEVTVQYAARLTAAVGAVPAAVAALTEGVLTSMFFSRLKLTAMVAVVAISLVASAAVLAQQGSLSARESQAQAADPTSTLWTYEILVSRDGRNSRKLATITVTDGNPTTLETPDEVIVIRPKTHSKPLASSNEQQRNASSAVKKSLAEQLEMYKRQINEKRAELKALMMKRTVDATKEGESKPKKNNDDRSPRAPGTLDEQRIRLAREMIDTQLKIIKVESDLQAAEDAAGIPPADKLWEQQIQDQFRRDPEVLALTDEIQLAAETRDRARSMSRQKNDPARRLAERKYNELTAKYDELWKAKYREISDQLRSKNINGAQSVDKLRRTLATLKALKAKQHELLLVLDAQEREVNDDEFDAAFLQHQLDILMRREEQVRAQLQQLELGSSQDRDRAPRVGN